MLSLCEIDRGSKPWSGQANDCEICYFCLSTEHAPLRSKNKDWLAQNLDNVSE
jgi:hypothetical protein